MTSKLQERTCFSYTAHHLLAVKYPQHKYF